MCVPCKSVSAFVRAFVCVISRASPIFTPMRMHVRKWEEGVKNTSKQTFQVFVAAWYARNVFHGYIMTFNISGKWKVLALVDHLSWKIVPVSLARLP